MILWDRNIFFSHISGTAGTTIEEAFLGCSQWWIDPMRQHVPMSTLYQMHNDVDFSKMFKFSVVRHPFERIRSLWRFAKCYPFVLNEKGQIDIHHYIRPNQRIYMDEVPSIMIEELLGLRYSVVPRHWHVEGTTYMNTLDKPCDKIYKFEELSDCFDDLSDRFNVPREKFNRNETQKSRFKPYLSEKSKEIIRRVQRLDFEKFGYDPYLPDAEASPCQ